MQWIIGSSVTAIVIMGLRYLLQRRVKATWLYGLWMILMVRLICPYLPTSPISVLNTVRPTYHREEKVEQEKSLIYREVQESINPSASQADANQILDSNISPNKSPTKKLEIKNNQIGIVIWSIGFMLVLLYFISIDRKIRREVKVLEVVKDEEVNHLVLDYQDRLKLLTNMRVKWGKTPMSYGIFKPIIILTKGYEKEELESILVHEMMHHKYGDLVINFLQMIILSVHWFNPLVWFAIYLMKQDTELACDERVIKELKNKQIYAKVLLEVSEQGHTSYLAGSYMSLGKNQLKGRIIAMSKIKKQGVIGGTVIVVCGIVVAMVCLTNQGKVTQPEKPIPVFAEVSSEENKNVWAKISQLQFSNSVQHIEASESGKYAYIFDDEPRLALSKNRDKLYVVTEDGQISEDYLMLTDKVIRASYPETELGTNYTLLDQTYGWIKEEGKEYFEAITVVTGGDGWDNCTARQTTVSVKVDPTDLSDPEVVSDTQTYGKEFKLTEKEQRLYDDYTTTKDVQVLKDISPIEAAKIITNCYKEGNKEAVYDLLIISESKELFVGSTTNRVPDSHPMKMNMFNGVYGLIDEALVKEYSHGTVELHYKQILNDRVGDYQITLKKIDNVWRMLAN